MLQIIVPGEIKRSTCNATYISKRFIPYYVVNQELAYLQGK